MKINLSVKQCMKAGIAAGICFAALACGGCEAIGAALYQVNGPAKEKAQYVPPKEPMLILVESFGNTGTVSEDSQMLSVSIARELTDNKVVPLVDPNKLERLRDANPDAYSRLTIADVGRKLGARQILYVNVAQAQLDIPPGSQSLHGIESVQVKVVDTQTAQTRWPIGMDEGQSLSIETPWQQNNSATAQRDAHKQMADQMGEKIGNLFHDYVPEPQDQAELNGY